MAAMFGQCLSAVTSCLYGEGGDWAGPGGVPVIPASQRIPEVILDTTTMGHEAVVVKNGLRLCGTGAARGSAPILQDKAYWEVSKLINTRKKHLVYRINSNISMEWFLLQGET